MKRSRTLSIAMMAVIAAALLATAACKSSGMAVTSRGQVLSLNIVHPKDLPEQGVDNLDIIVSNMGVNGIRDVLLEVELPPQLIVLDQTNDRGVEVMHTSGTNMWRFNFGHIQPAERSTIRFRVRTEFGNLNETGSVTATAWQSTLPGDRLVQTALIRLRP